jgi:hypothetical protein
MVGTQGGRVAIRDKAPRVRNVAQVASRSPGHGTLGSGLAVFSDGMPSAKRHAAVHLNVDTF